MVKQGDRQRHWILACALLMLQVTHSQGYPHDAPPESSGPGSVQGHGPYYHGPEGSEPPHWHRHRHNDAKYRRPDGPDSGPHSGPDSGPNSGPYLGPYYEPYSCRSCAGKVTAVWCWEDSTGRLQDIAYLNSESANSIATYLGCSGFALPTTTSTKTLILNPDESIVRIDTCDGKHGGYLESVSFVTDKRRRLICGKRHHSHHRDHYANNEAVSGADTVAPQDAQGKYHKDGAPKHDYGKSDYDKSGYGKPDYDKSDYGKSDYDKSGYGKPDYGKSDYDKPDYGKPGYGKPDYGEPDSGKSDSGKSGYDKSGYGKPDYDKSDYGKPGYGKPDYDKSDYGKPGYGEPDHDKPEHEYYPNHPDDGPKCNTVLSKHACWGHRRQTSRTFPLAGFAALCTPHKYVGAITDLCYNTNSTSCNPVSVGVPVTVGINLGSDPCPTTPQAIADLAAELRGISQAVSAASGNPPVIQSVAWGTCFTCAGATTQADEGPQLLRQLLQSTNTTLTSSTVIVVPNPPNTATNVTSLLNQSGNLCLINGTDTCTGPTIDSITVTT